VEISGSRDLPRGDPDSKTVKNIGKPCTGKPHARFNEGALVKRPDLYTGT